MQERSSPPRISREIRARGLPTFPSELFLTRSMSPGSVFESDRQRCMAEARRMPAPPFATSAPAASESAERRTRVARWFVWPQHLGVLHKVHSYLHMPRERKPAQVRSALVYRAHSATRVPHALTRRTNAASLQRPKTSADIMTLPTLWHANVPAFYACAPLAWKGLVRCNRMCCDTQSCLNRTRIRWVRKRALHGGSE